MTLANSPLQMTHCCGVTSRKLSPLFRDEALGSTSLVWTCLRPGDTTYETKTPLVKHHNLHPLPSTHPTVTIYSHNFHHIPSLPPSSTIQRTDNQLWPSNPISGFIFSRVLNRTISTAAEVDRNKRERVPTIPCSSSFCLYITDGYL